MWERRAEWREATMGAVPPLTSAVHVMRQIDNLPPDVRKLIYEYGLVAVATYYNNGLRKRGLEQALKAHRRERQRQWLTSDIF